MPNIAADAEIFRKSGKTIYSVLILTDNNSVKQCRVNWT